MALPKALQGVPAPVLIAGGAAVIVALWIALRGFKGAGKDVGAAVVDVADGVVSGAVEQIGGIAGIPKTGVQACQACIEEFRAAPWYEQAGLSFKVASYCSAPDYVKFMATGKGPLDV